MYNTIHISLVHDRIGLKDEPFIGVTLEMSQLKLCCRPTWN